MRRPVRLGAAIAIAALLASSCEAPASAPAPSGSSTSSSSPATSSTVVPSGRPVAHTRPLPNCAALTGLVPPGVLGAAGTPTARPGSDGWREWAICEVSGTVPGTTTSARVQVMLERPLLDPVEGVPVDVYLAGRPEKLIKDRCPDFPYTAISEISHGFACYLHQSATEAQGLVSGSTGDGTALITVTVSDAGRTPAELRTAAEATARAIATAIVRAS